MKQTLRSRLDQIDQLTLRERAILGIVLLTAIWAVTDVILLTPLQQARQAEAARLQEVRARIEQMQTMLGGHEARPSAQEAARRRLQAAQAALDAQARDTAELQRYLVSAEKMIEVLQALTRERPGLSLLALESLPPQPLAAQQSAVGETVYRQGVVLTLGGSYAALVDYMQEVERLPMRFFWAKASLDAREHPALVLTLTLYSLSPEGVWLRL